MSEALPVGASIEQRQPLQPAALAELVNRLAQELVGSRRALDAASRKLDAASQRLESQTRELTKARNSTALLLAALDCATEGILAIGSGRAMLYNTRFVEMWHIPADKLAALTDSALLAMQLAQVRDPERFLAHVWQGQDARGIERCNVIEMTDGRILECRVTPQLVRGQRVGAVTTFRDVTEHGRLQRPPISSRQAQMPREAAEAAASTC